MKITLSFPDLIGESSNLEIRNWIVGSSPTMTFSGQLEMSKSQIKKVEGSR